MQKAERQTAPETGPGYLRESRSLGMSIVSIMPLIILYHCGIVQQGSSVRNLAEVWLTGPLRLVGLTAAHVLNVALIVALLAVLWRTEAHAPSSFLVVVLMIAEGALYALALNRGAPALAAVIDRRASGVLFAVNWSRAAPLLLALGAGVYEELLFRLLLLGGGAYLLQSLFLWNRKWSLLVMLAVSSLAFSAAHYVGPLADQFRSYDFIFRAVCGAVLGLIFLGRGLGVAVWTHAIYNALALAERLT